MAQSEKQPTTLTAKNRPSWPIRTLRKVFRIEPEIYEQERNFTFNRYGMSKSAGGKFAEIDTDDSMAIYRPSAGQQIDAGKALANNTGYVYAAVKAIGHEVMNIEFRLFQVNGKNHKEQEDHDLLDLLDGVNEFMTGPELKFLTSAHLDLAGNAYWYLEGVKNDLDKPKGIYPLNPSDVSVLIDRTTFPYQLLGYKIKIGNSHRTFKPYEILHLRDPDPSNAFLGVGTVQSIASWIDLDNYAMEFNRKFFVNGARPAGFLESGAVAETQIESLKIGFMDVHGGIDNMNRIAVLPKGVTWKTAGSSPKDMDFKNLSEDVRDRILAGFRVSKTILGTAESDTNRATAETADYVFSKRVIRPRMQLICSFLNEKLVPRYGDNLYITFIDPVPEDRQFRTQEMQAVVDNQPVLTVNEAREEFMGLGPVEGGDVLMSPTTMGPVGEPTSEGDVTPEADKGSAKDIHDTAVKAKIVKAANGERVAFRPPRAKLQSRAKQRSEMAKSLAEKVAEELKKKLGTKKFETDPEKKLALWKEFDERTRNAEKEIVETVHKLNEEQQKEVLANLDKAIEKAVNPAKLFDIEKWISLTVDALTPTLEKLFEAEGLIAASKVGKPNLNPLTEPAAQKALHESVQRMAKSYNETTLATLESKINEGLSAGAPLSEIRDNVKQIYEWSDTWRAERVARTESFRAANYAQREAWRQSGVVHSLTWYTAGNKPCEFCESLNGSTVSIDKNFLDQGDSLTVGDQTMNIDYSGVGAPPLHPNCQCTVLPEDISLD
ncbi:MAG TPA: phage portal protein [Patescibacteria group bacterium]|nr:phage portal protein [Patescibacteria group bacterium]